MKKNTTIALFGSMFVGVAILLGMTGSDLTALAVASTPTTISDNNAGIYGHITLTVTDEDGKIKNYIQTDNTIIQTGSDCVVVEMFGTTGGTENCVNDTADFNFIQLGTGGGACSGQPASNAEALSTPLLAATDAAMAKKIATTIDAGAASGSGATATISAAFTPSGGPHTIDEALLSNLVTEGLGDTIANQCFTDIVVTSADTLTVEWVITIGGA